MGYRAWGELKALNYGNNFTLAASYNSRQQLQSLKQYRSGGPTAIDKTYQYYPDGKIKFSDDVKNQGTFHDKFDRAFTYDQVGRLTNAWAGAQARNFINDNFPIEAEIVPYSLRYQYDVWGNQTSQSGKIWSLDINETVSYQNMRRDNWTYDAAGNVTNDGSTPFTYDAAGRNVSVGSASTESTQTFDGDGLVGRRDPHMPRTSNDFDSHPIFYVRSAVLGGKVIIEIDGRGTNWGASLRGRRLDSYVYSGETRIAKQRVFGESSTTQHVIWNFIDPITGSEAFPSPDGSFITGQVEPDPMGINVGLVDPAELPPLTPQPEQPDYFGDGGGWNPLQPRFTIDGMQVDQAFAMVMLETRNGAAVVAPAEEYITIIRHGKLAWARWQAFGDGYQGYLPHGAKYLGNGEISYGNTGRPTLYKRAPGSLPDTDLGKLNGATGEATLGRSMGFGFGFGLQAQPQLGFGLQAQPQQGGGDSNSTNQDTSCIVTLGSRGLNYPGLQSIFHHMFITTQGASNSTPIVFQGIHPDKHIHVRKEDFKAGNDDYDQSRNPGAIFVSVKVPGPCDKINDSFRDTAKKINDANIDYEVPIYLTGWPLPLSQVMWDPFPDNSNAAAYTFLERWSPEYRGILENKYAEKSGRPFGTFNPGWGNPLVK